MILLKTKKVDKYINIYLILYNSTLNYKKSKILI